MWLESCTVNTKGCIKMYCLHMCAPLQVPRCESSVIIEEILDDKGPDATSSTKEVAPSSPLPQAAGLSNVMSRLPQCCCTARMIVVMQVCMIYQIVHRVISMTATAQDLGALWHRSAGQNFCPASDSLGALSMSAYHRCVYDVWTTI